MNLPIQISIGKQSTLPPAPTRPPLWIHREDHQVTDSSWGGGIRPCAPCPAVWVLQDDPHVAMTEQWQYYLRAINYNMTLENVYLLLDKALAFANGTGFRDSSDPRADYFHRRDLDQKPPNLDKVRTCSRSVLSGAPGYRLLVALRQTVSAVTDRIRGVRSALAARSIRSLLVDPNVLQVAAFDSRQQPPLQPGRSYPSRVEDVSPDDYLYLPETHPWLFLTATIVNRSGECVQFPRGAVYPWAGDGAPRSFVPHIANATYGPVAYPLTRLRPLRENEPIPSPYRFN